jgi:hypothetical protein
MSYSREQWRPRWATPSEPHIALVYTTEGKAEVTALQSYGENTCQFVARFLEQRLACGSEADLESDVSFVYVLLNREPAQFDSLEVEPGGVLIEYGFGVFPAAPEEWPEVPLRDLLNETLLWLTGSPVVEPHPPRQ